MPDPMLQRLEDEKQEETVLLYGSGIDSYCISQILEPDVNLFIDDGLERVDDEKELSKKAPVDVTYLETGLEQFAYEVDLIPFREWFHVLYGLQYGDEVILGSVVSDTMPTLWGYHVSLLSGMVRSCSEATHGMHPRGVLAPYVDKRKSEVVKDALKKVDGEEIIRWTRSCDYQGDSECGECMSCIRKAAALELNNMGVRDEFEEDPLRILKSEFMGEKIYGFEVEKNIDLIEWVEQEA